MARKWHIYLLGRAISGTNSAYACHINSYLAHLLKLINNFHVPLLVQKNKTPLQI
jgi:hypothetical protein